MPLKRLSSSEATQNARSNTAKSWPNRAEPGNRVEPITTPAISPRFKIDASDSVFTVGSCFARNVEAELERLGFDVPMRRLDLSTAPDGGEALPEGSAVFNNYAVPSILNELRWALDDSTPFDPEKNLVKIGDDRYYDLHLTNIARPNTLEQCLYRRRNIKSGFESVKTCKCVIMTLGLVEVWYDREAETYLNVSPPRDFMRRFPDRFELHVMNHAEVTNYLERIYGLLDRYCVEGYQSLLTVSPVPLNTTFTDRDVIIANQYSKAVLRVASEELVSKRENVDYYPSFESLVLSDRLRAWDDDMRHPTRELVSLNVSRMIEAYTDVKFDTLPPLDRIRQMLGSGQIQAAKELLDTHQATEADDLDVAVISAEIALELNDDPLFERATDTLAGSAPYRHHFQRLIFRKARLTRQRTLYDNAKAQIDLLPTTFATVREVLLAAGTFDDWEYAHEMSVRAMEQWKRHPFLLITAAEAAYSLRDHRQSRKHLEQFLDFQNDPQGRGNELLKKLDGASSN